MAFDELILCRLISRIYSILAFDENGISVMTKEELDFWFQTKTTREYVQLLLCPLKIIMSDGSITSSHSSKNISYTSAMFTYKGKWRLVPYFDFLINHLNNTRMASGIPLYFGYNGRNYSDYTLTDGYYNRNIKHIVLDLPSHTVFPEDVLVLRLAHELLHSVGLEEKEVIKHDKRIAMDNYEQILPFAREIKSVIDDIYFEFCNILKTFNEHHSKLIDELIGHANKLVELKSFPPAKTVVYKKMSVPRISTRYGDIGKKSFEVLYM